MTIQSVIKMGNPDLAVHAVTVQDHSNPIVQATIRDMIDTMHARGGVGIAAPQIGVSLRIIVFGFDTNPRYPDEQPIPLTILINPVINVLSRVFIDGWEGCLSVPGLRGLVPRFKKIQYQGLDEHGKLISREAEGFHARVVQHECDHLNGILFPQRIHDLHNFGYEDELKNIIWPHQSL